VSRPRNVARILRCFDLDALAPRSFLAAATTARRAPSRGR
jgi:hypothetical protein